MYFKINFPLMSLDSCYTEVLFSYHFVKVLFILSVIILCHMLELSFPVCCWPLQRVFLFLMESLS